MIYEWHILVNFEFVQTIQDIGCILNFFYFLNDLQIVKFEFEQTVQDVRKDLDVQYILCSWQNILKPFNPRVNKYKILDVTSSGRRCMKEGHITISSG